jgi:hypothetical protein
MQRKFKVKDLKWDSDDTGDFQIITNETEVVIEADNEDELDVKYEMFIDGIDFANQEVDEVFEK